MFKKTALLIIVFILAICNNVKLKRYEAQFLLLFDTQTKIVGYSKSKVEFSRFSKLIYDNLKEYHELYDIYNNYDGINNIKTINDNAGIKPVIVDKRIIDLLKFSKSMYELTDGRVNIAMGSVLKIWHDYRTEGISDFENAKLPPIELLKEANEHTDIKKIIINEDESTVFLDDAKMSLDVGAVAKGYSVERVSLIAYENGFTNGLISVGGNVRTLGDKGVDKSPWNIGIQNPDFEGENIHTVYLKDMSLVTSGVYQRYYTVLGKRYHHIINPDSLMPAEYFKAATILCKDSGVADALSTAVFNMPFEKGLQFIENQKDVEALWVLNSGELKYSSGFLEYSK